MPKNYAKNILGNLSKGMRLAWCTMSSPLPPPAPPPLHSRLNGINARLRTGGWCGGTLDVFAILVVRWFVSYLLDFRLAAGNL